MRIVALQKCCRYLVINTKYTKKISSSFESSCLLEVSADNAWPRINMSMAQILMWNFYIIPDGNLNKLMSSFYYKYLRHQREASSSFLKGLKTKLSRIKMLDVAGNCSFIGKLWVPKETSSVM